MEDFSEEKRREILENRFRIWRETLRDLERTAEPGHTVVRFPNSSTYFFSTGSRTFWCMDPSFNAKQIVESERDEIASLMAEKIAFILLTHLHIDHCQMDLVRKLRGSGIRWIVSDRFRDAFLREGGLDAAEVVTLPDGAAVELDGIRIEAQRGYHAEPGKADVPECSYDITLPDGVRLFFPADIRDFQAPIPHRDQPIDYLFAHVFLGRDDATGDNFSKLEDFADFMTRRKSANLILTHLYEVGRLARDLWTERHAALAAAAIRRRDPELRIFVPRFGDLLHLVRDPESCADPFKSWPEAERRAFLEQLGVSLKKDHAAWMERAIAERIPVVEWMYDRALALDPALRLDQLRRWREAGGHCLSIHFPKLPLAPDPEAEAKTAATVRLALESRADRVTVHVPDFPVGEAESRLEAAVERYVALLKPLLEAGIRIGIENLHMKPRHAAGPGRPFGFTPEECVRMVDALRAKTGSELWGFHFDIGHAYSNHPYAETYGTAAWLERTGPLVNGVHLHQFLRPRTAEEPLPEGHYAIIGRTAGHPSLLPLFAAWRRGAFRVPMILEIMRGEEGEPFSSLARLRAT